MNSALAAAQTERAVQAAGAADLLGRDVVDGEAKAKAKATATGVETP